MARFFRAERRWLLLTASLLGAFAVALTLAINIARGYPIVSLVAALAIAGTLHRLWVRAGRPSGVAEAERMAEAEVAPGHPASPCQAYWRR